MLQNPFSVNILFGADECVIMNPSGGDYIISEKADKTEYTYCGDQREGDCWSVKCPCCGHRAHDIQQRDRLSQIIDKEIKMQQKESNYWENR